MNAQSARDYILNRPMKLEAVDVKDFWPDLDGLVFIQDVPGDELTSMQTLLKNDPMKLSASVLCKALVAKDKDAPDAPAQPVFQPTDRDAVAHLGTGVLLPVMLQVMKFLGMDDSDVVEALKKS